MFIVDLTDPDIELDELIFHKPNSTTLCRSASLLLIRINSRVSGAYLSVTGERSKLG